VLIAVVIGAALAPPAAARVAFTNGSEVATVNADGSERTTLLRPDSGRAAGPDWSPDGARIALAVGHGGSTSRLAVMAADGSGLQHLTRSPRRDTFEADPAWSPDGTRIAFVRTRIKAHRVFNLIVSIAPDGSDERKLLVEASRALVLFSAPAWSPDGRRIVFTRERVGRNLHLRPSLREIAAAGGTPTLLMRDAQSLTWSPDGRRTAYVSVADRNGRTCGDDTCVYNGEIYTRDASGGPATRITRSRANDRSPEWSPDGERIAFASDRNYPLGESAEIYTMRPDGSCVTWLTNGTPASEDPSWEPGGPSDPGACGALPLEPLVSVDLRFAQRYRLTPAYWLGPTSQDGLLLSEAFGYPGGTGLGYADCAQFDPHGCPLPFALDSSPVCEREPAAFGHGFHPRLVHEVAGLLVYRYPGEESLVDVYTGRTKIATSVRGLRRLAEIIPRLRLLGEDEPAELPRSALPDFVWRDLERGRSRRARATLREVEAYGAGRIDC
jgi:Tol biopolymer transport system component